MSFERTEKSPSLARAGRPSSFAAGLATLAARALLAALALQAGCGGNLGTTDAAVRRDTGPSSTASVTASWLVRCDALMDCTPNPVRMLAVTNGVGGALVECSAPLVGADREISVRFEQPTEFGLALSGIVTSPTGGRVSGAACSVDVLESAEMLSLRGPCSANPPSADAPCQVQRVVIDEDTRAVSLEVRCEGLGTIDGTGVERELTDPDTAAGFVEIAITQCEL
jgi:hypothetical protein